ncbi:MAG: biotin attachment protein [Alcaligenaceae bacterium]|nr:MAG: biotin attachment protein [Alcaligenaceae bacterium]
MRKPIEMPHMGYDMESGVVEAWIKNVGDQVSRGEEIVEISTDKTTVAIESMHDGMLCEIVMEPGSEVKVGAVIAWVESEE